ISFDREGRNLLKHCHLANRACQYACTSTWIEDVHIGVQSASDVCHIPCDGRRRKKLTGVMTMCFIAIRCVPLANKMAHFNGREVRSDSWRCTPRNIWFELLYFMQREFVGFATSHLLHDHLLILFYTIL